MSTERRYEILDSLPAYGPMYIPISEDGELFYSEGFPVRFFKTDKTEWVANFKTGVTNLKKVIPLQNTDNLLVIAYGTCYLVNPDISEPVSVFGVDYSNIYNANNNRIILQNSTELTIIESDASYWVTDRIAWDGIKDVKIEGNIVTGLAYELSYNEDIWISFNYDIDTKVLTGGSYSQHQNKKPWWKIW